MKNVIELFIFILILSIILLNTKNTYNCVFDAFYGMNNDSIIEGNVFKDLGKKIKAGVDKAINAVKKEVNKIKDQILGIFNKIEEAFREISRVLRSIPGRMANIERGFQLSMEAIGDEVENLGKGLGLGFKTTFDVIGETGIYTVNALECGVNKIEYLPQCFPIYLWDGFIGLLKVMFKSIMNAAELYIGFKRNFGIDMHFYMNYMYSMLMEMDKIAYNMSGFHFMKYPEFILNRCYRCKGLDSSKIISKSKEVGRAWNQELPRLLNEPVYKFKRAQDKFESAFR